MVFDLQDTDAVVLNSNVKIHSMSDSSGAAGLTRFAGVPSFVLAVVLTVAYVQTIAVWRWLGTVLPSGTRSAFPFIVTGVVLVAAVGVGLVLRRRKIRAQWGVVLLGVALAVATLFLSDPRFPAKRIHVVEYGLLAIVVRHAFSYRLGGASLLWASVVVTALLGCHEELLQGLHPLRTYGPDDIGRNVAAALAGGLIGHGLHLFQRPDRPREDLKPMLSLEAAAVMLGAALLLASLASFRSDWIPWWTLAPLLAAGALWCRRFGVWTGSFVHPFSLGFWLCQTMILYPLLANVSPLVLH